MNYTWETLFKKGQPAIGYVDAFKLESPIKAIVIINYLPQFEGTEKQVVHVTIFLEGKKGDWTKGQLSSIMQDAGDCVDNNEYFKYKILNSLDYLNTQTFYVEKLNNIDYLSHGDYTHHL